MNGCTATDKPLISILMAVHEPRMDWLREQLCSLERQSYPALELLICDDASRSVTPEELRICVSECVRSFPVTVERCEENLGSDAVFASLIGKAQGKYIAFCDQDDVWYPDKLARMEDTIRRTGARLVCSDMRIIDADGAPVADSITALRRHHVFRSGTGLTAWLWKSNFASGCAMLVRTEDAKAALPLNPYMYYDHYIALWAAAQGSIVSLPEPTLDHREHGENQSSLLRGVNDRESYRRIRIEKRLNSLRWLSAHFPADEPLRSVLPRALAWMEARDAYFAGDRRAAKTLWKHRHFSRKETLFELCSPLLPEKAFRRIVRMGQENRL